MNNDVGELLTINIGEIANSCAKEMWKKLQKDYAIDNEAKRINNGRFTSNFQTMFSLNKENQFVPRSIFVHLLNSDPFLFRSNFEPLSYVHKNFNYLIKIDEGELSLTCPSDNFENLNDSIYYQYENIIRKQIEKSNLFQGSLILNSSKEDKSYVPIMITYNILKSFKSKTLNISIPLSFSNTKEISFSQCQSDFFNITSMIKNANMIFPIDFKSISNKLEYRTFEKAMQNMNEIISSVADVILLLSSPLRNEYLPEITMSSLISYLVRNPLNKFVNSNMFPFYSNKGANNLAFEKNIAKELINGQGICGYPLTNQFSSSNLLIANYPISNDFQRFLNNTILKWNSSFTRKISYDKIHMIMNRCNYPFNFFQKVLFCSNSASILPYLKSISKDYFDLASFIPAISSHEYSRFLNGINKDPKEIIDCTMQAYLNTFN